MSAVTHEHEDHHNARAEKRKCMECSDPIHRYPFLQWNDILICGDCCRKIKRGFIADLVHVAAIEDLFDIGYREETLVRQPIKRAEAEWCNRMGIEVIKRAKG